MKIEPKVSHMLDKFSVIELACLYILEITLFSGVDHSSFSYQPLSPPV